MNIMHPNYQSQGYPSQERQQEHQMLHQGLQNGLGRNYFQQEQEQRSPFESFTQFSSRNPSFSMFQFQYANDNNLFGAAQYQQIEKNQIHEGGPLKMKIYPKLFSIQDQQEKQNENLEKEQIDKKRSFVKILILVILALLFSSLFAYQIYVRELIKDAPSFLGPYPKHLQKWAWLKSYQIALARKQHEQMEKMYHTSQDFYTLKHYAKQMKKNREGPVLFKDIIFAIQQLPFCVFVTQLELGKQVQILHSIMQTQYKNLIIILPSSDSEEEETVFNLQVKRIILNSFNYTQIYQILRDKCRKNSLVSFIHHRVASNYFSHLNFVHQHWNVYITFSEDSGQLYQVYSFYIRLFQLLKLNDFSQTNIPFLESGHFQIFTLGLLQIGIAHSYLVQRKLLVDNTQERLSLVMDINSQNTYKRTAYEAILRLSDDFENFVTRKTKAKMIEKFVQNQENIYNISLMTMKKLQQAMQYNDVYYLPEEHSLVTRQFLHYNKTYKIEEYSKNQLPFCVTILSHNNIENNRFKKVLNSILSQAYTNYRIIFIDDLSDDETLFKTIQFLKQKEFPEDRVTFIRNNKHQYATYNILNSAFNFCKEEQIQILIDGDDQLVGLKVFQLINSVYSRYPQSWVVYTNCKTNMFQSRCSANLVSKQMFLSENNQRVSAHILGQLRTWRTKLIKLIPKVYHLLQSGLWLDTVYDDALQHSLFQMSTISRVRYVPQICYEYNRNYGDNDDSSSQKVIHRRFTYLHLLKLKPLQQIKMDLKDTNINKEMQEIFKEERVKNGFSIVSFAEMQKYSKK